jgi:hypothetical protein
MSSHVKNVELFKFTIVPYKMVLNDNSFLKQYATGYILEILLFLSNSKTKQISSFL